LDFVFGAVGFSTQKYILQSVATQQPESICAPGSCDRDAEGNIYVLERIRDAADYLISFSIPAVIVNLIGLHNLHYFLRTER